MNVHVEIQLTQFPTEHDEHQMYEAAERLTNEPTSIVITRSTNTLPAIIAEFTMPNARQIDVVERIARTFRRIDHYTDSSIAFPKTRVRRTSRALPRHRQNESAYTPKQGQYLSFIYYYTKIHRIAPAEADFQAYFRVTPPTVHRMIVQLEQRGFISRIPRQSRSIRLLPPREQLPDLT